MSTIVKYNGLVITPAPFVSRNFTPYDIGQRWGYSETIKLDGMITGGQGTGKIAILTNLFGESYKSLTVDSAGVSGHIDIPNCVIDNISIGENRFGFDATNAIPYSVTLKAYGSTSGVIDVSDSFSYTDSENGIISIAHSVSAKGVFDGNDPIDNAYSFVSQFTGRNPVLFASPVFNRSGLPILKSVNEQIDRAAGSYEVSETWEYETGRFNPFTTVSTLSIENSVESENPTLNLSVEFGGSITGSFAALRSEVSSFDYSSKLTEFGLTPSDFFLSSFSLEETEPDSINATINYISGLSSEFTTGVFKHDVNLDWDEIEGVKTYSINSEFVIKGTPQHRATQIENQKSQIIADYSHYAAFLYHKILDSELYAQFGDRPLHPYPTSFTIKSDKTEPTLSFSASYSDFDYVALTTKTLPNGLSYPIAGGYVKYNLDFEPESWIFEMEKAANIEGHFIVQDLNCKTRDKFSLNATVEHLRETLENGADVSSRDSLNQMLVIHTGIADSLALNRYETNSNLNSGMHSHSIQRSYFAKTAINPSLSANKFYGFLAGTYNTRNAGHKYGF